MPPTAALRPLFCAFAPLLMALAAQAQGLPPAVLASLKQAQLPPEALAVVVQELGNPVAGRRDLAWQARLPMNPASLVKLATTYAALDQLGPAWTWTTPVWLQGKLHANGVLEGDLVIKGSGDPKLVLERLWLLLRRVQQQGVREIRGDIVLDGSAFSPPEAAPGDFDGEPWRPANVQPDALLLNYKSVVYSFRPDAAAGVARITADPALARVAQPASVPLAPGPCADWRAALKPQWQNPLQIRFGGAYPAACGELRWPVAHADPKAYNARLVTALWRDMGGKLSGNVRDGQAPAGLKPGFEFTSPPLAEVVRDINKFSNNLMAQQLFLSLPLQQGASTSTPELARESLRQWLAAKLGAAELAGLVLDNGSGLSRNTRVSAQQLGLLLQQAWVGPVMPELMASLPVAGLDGTLARPERRLGAAQARAHLKTGSLRDVLGVAGYVLASSGRRYVLVALVNHPQAPAARAALDALVQWVADDNTAP